MRHRHPDGVAKQTTSPSEPRALRRLTQSPRPARDSRGCRVLASPRARGCSPSRSRATNDVVPTALGPAQRGLMRALPSQLGAAPSQAPWRPSSTGPAQPSAADGHPSAAHLERCNRSRRARSASFLTNSRYPSFSRRHREAESNADGRAREPDQNAARSGTGITLFRRTRDRLIHLRLTTHEGDRA